MVKQILENTVRQMEAERDRQLACVKEKVTREKIVPHNREVDEMRDKAIAELSSALNTEIAELQERFNSEKEKLVEIGEKDKTAFANTAYATESALVAKKYDDAIRELKAQIAKIKE